MNTASELTMLMAQSHRKMEMMRAQARYRLETIQVGLLRYLVLDLMLADAKALIERMTVEAMRLVDEVLSR